MPNENLTEIVVILDRSGSMSAIRADMEGGFASFIAEQKAVPAPCVVSLYQFDDRFEVVYQETPIEHAPRLNLDPRGMTALLDAMARTINIVGVRLAAKPDHLRPGKVVVMVITDGQENASREFNRSQVRSMVEHQTKVYDWQFAFLGANIDSIAVGADIGISAQATSNFSADSRGVTEMYGASSRGIGAYRVAPRGAQLKVGPTKDKV